MSVYTSLAREQIESFIAPYALGRLIHFQGISAGIENTNYLLTTAQGRFVLTLYEHFNVSEVQCYLQLLRQLAHRADYYPYPLVDAKEVYLQVLSDKPAALFHCLPGASLQSVSVQQIEAVALALAHLHVSAASLSFSRENRRGLAWLKRAGKKIASALSAQEVALLDNELAFQMAQNTTFLPQGIIHADLFKDNVLFVGNNLTGMLDFYAACCDCFLLDIAIALNDWCVDEQGIFRQEWHEVFMRSYQQVRPLIKEELACLPVFLRRASLRFWVSRWEHQLYSQSGEVTQEKDPDIFKRLLRQHQDAEAAA